MDRGLPALQSQTDLLYVVYVTPHAAWCVDAASETMAKPFQLFDYGRRRPRTNKPDEPERKKRKRNVFGSDLHTVGPAEMFLQLESFL